ncbi:hypothetical protein BV22DRAFT_1000478 [Leucogyrophana mollusca]|uniref:Uncharacterized protein n=1 Tax=Leucogyrophana mollusca TaxID=85980 RepID=A0ACB8BZL8_9AGAM|nr:hypothetical protein BV22DRAFT_1000478 [Leucogyrophana mollusca]
MPTQYTREIVGDLSKEELVKAVPKGTFSRGLRHVGWGKIIEIISGLPNDVRDAIRRAADEKKKNRVQNRLRRDITKYAAAQDSNHGVAERDDAENVVGDDRDHSKFMEVPTEWQEMACFRAFREATSNKALARSVCIICGREMMSDEGAKTRKVLSIPNIRQKLRPEVPNSSHVLWEELLLVHETIRGQGTAATGWAGTHPDHLQRGILGNVSLYNMNMDAVARMLEGQLLPQPAAVLASVLAITYVGTKKLPKTWLKSTFRVRRRVVYEALIWLKKNNPIFADIEISGERLNGLPEDDVPDEITSVMHQEMAEGVNQEGEGYVPETAEEPTSEDLDDEGADVIPLKFLGITDTNLNKVPLDDLMKYALTNMDDESKEGGYVVRHSRLPVSDFGKWQADDGSNGTALQVNPLAAAYPKLFPYGVGGIEADHNKTVGFDEHIRWALQYYDRRFRLHHSFLFVAFGIHQKREALRSARIQMRRRDFEHDAIAIGSLTVADLKQAEKEEASHLPISNPRVRLLRKHVFNSSGRVKGSDNSRATYRGQIWGTSLILRGPVVWITINPSDTHDPVAQVFAGENIDMDQFFATGGPDSDRRARNIARDPYAAAKYFFFIINAVLRSLFQVEVVANRVHSKMGILGLISAYFGVIEAQGRGTLHTHMKIWLCHTPNMIQMGDLLQSQEFRDRMCEYMRHNIRAHLDGLTEEEISKTRKETQLPYSRPPNPSMPGWKEEMNNVERRVVRAQQVHVCTKATCLKFNGHGRLVCKRHAPWELSAENYVNEFGKWKPKRTYGFLNNWCPGISTTLCCNNDIKLITNGRDTKDMAWYTTDYQTKKQNKNNNVSALMAQTLVYHQEHSDHTQGLLDRNRLLLFRCQHSINREMELSGPQVVAYLMGWGDTFCSHHYVPIYWSSVKAALLKVFPELGERKHS